MKTISLFEAKTRLSEICEEVSSQGQPVLVTRRGHPIVRIEPVASDQRARNVWISRQAWLEENGPIDEDFLTPDPGEARGPPLPLLILRSSFAAFGLCVNLPFPSDPESRLA